MASVQDIRSDPNLPPAAAHFDRSSTVHAVDVHDQVDRGELESQAPVAPANARNSNSKQGEPVRVNVRLQSAVIAPGSPYHKYAEQLKEADVDGDGVISLPEVIQLFRRLAKEEQQIRFFKGLAIALVVAVVVIVAVLGGVTFWLLQLTKEAKVQNNAFLVPAGQTNTGVANQAVLVGKPLSNFTLDTSLAQKSIRRVLLATATTNDSDSLVAFGTATREVIARACNAYNQGYLSITVHVQLTDPGANEADEVKIVKAEGCPTAAAATEIKANVIWRGTDVSIVCPAQASSGTLCTLYARQSEIATAAIDLTVRFTRRRLQKFGRSLRRSLMSAFEDIGVKDPTNADEDSLFGELEEHAATTGPHASDGWHRLGYFTYDDCVNSAANKSSQSHTEAQCGSFEFSSRRRHLLEDRVGQIKLRMMQQRRLLACFHASGTLRLEDGRRLRLDSPALRSGRGLPRAFRVQAAAPDGSLRFATFYGHVHKPHYLPAPFVRISTRSSSLLLTPGHFVYVAEAPSWGAARVEVAARVQRGHFVFVEREGRPQLAAEQVTAVEDVVERGAFGFWVEGGLPLVNGVAASVTAVDGDYNLETLRSNAESKTLVRLFYWFDQAGVVSTRFTYPFFLALARNPRLAFERFSEVTGHAYVLGLAAALAAWLLFSVASGPRGRASRIRKLKQA